MNYLDINVLEAAKERIRYMLENTEAAYVAFSGGKDSGVLLELVLAEAEVMNKRVGVFHLDYEAQYQMTTDYTDEVYDALPDYAEPYRCCVPVRCPTCTSMFESHWRPWEDSKRGMWVRELPHNAFTAEDLDGLDIGGMTDYEFQDAFGQWYAKKSGAKTVAAFIGIRAQESLDRWRTIAGEVNGRRNFNEKPWTTVKGRVINAYPIYDWQTEDIWKAYADHGWNYNKLYDLLQMAGVPIHAQRVASPFHDAAKSSLSLYRVVDPNTWGLMVSRVNGVNCTAIYGGTTLMGWKKIQKPDHLTWQQYALFLLDTLPPEAANAFRKKLKTSIKFWSDNGGCLSDEAIADIEKAGIQWRPGKETARKTEKRPVCMDYADDIDSAEFRLIPTWKRICVCILKNDHVGKYMGFGMTKHEADKKKKSMELINAL